VDHVARWWGTGPGGTVEPGDSVVLDCHRPLPLVQESVVSGAQEDRVPEGGLAAVGPVFDVVQCQ
jgi:hypothetical protein